MPIRKYGTEPAKVETRVEDNDPETLSSVGGQAQDEPESKRRKLRRVEVDGEFDF